MWLASSTSDQCKNYSIKTKILTSCFSTERCQILELVTINMERRLVTVQWVEFELVEIIKAWTCDSSGEDGLGLGKVCCVFFCMVEIIL